MRLSRYLSALILLASVGLAQQSVVPEDRSASAAPVKTAPPIDLQPDASGMVLQEQFRELLRYAQDREVENEKRLRDYTYIEREEQHKLDGNGDVKKVEIRTREVLEIYGEPVERLIEKDDKPISEDEAKKEDEKIQRFIDKRKNESESERRKRLEREEKEREEDRKFVLEIADAFNFRLVGSEEMNGRETWVIDCEPRPEYQPKERETRILSKFRGWLWIDKQEGQWAKFDITAIDTVSVGWFLVRLHKGARIVAEQVKVNDEVWLPKHVSARVDARLALVKGFNEEIDETYRDYKKFRAESKITAVGETQ